LSMNVSRYEDMWLEVAIKSKTVLLVGAVYRHPKWELFIDILGMTLTIFNWLLKII